jgi:DNA modification methylase|tara:strand:- start:2904 stop:4127 length:1224 start_codon:yes stop_codon:yes gene_type:complete
MKKKIKDIIINRDLWPRLEEDLKKIQEYSENIERLPPIIINQKNILIDGFHRIKAHRTAQLNEIECNVESVDNDDEIYLRSIELNATHGLQLSYKDKKSIAVKLYDGKNSERLIKALSISERTFRGWSSNKRKQLEQERNDKILDLYLKCFTHEQIAKELDIDRTTVTKFIDNVNIGKIAEFHNFKPFLYNLWNTSNIKNEQKHFGNFPIEFMENLLYYYTKPFEVVYDPFAGGGVTIDACKKWFRRYYTSDLNPIPAREEDIKKHNILKELPNDLPKVDFVFLDPPYWKQAENIYSKDKDDLANMSLDKFYNSIDYIIKSLRKKLSKGAYVAFVISATQWKNNLEREDHILKIYNLFIKNKFELNERIILPYSSEQYNAQQVNIIKDKKIMLNIYRDLVIFKNDKE